MKKLKSRFKRIKCLFGNAHSRCKFSGEYFHLVMLDVITPSDYYHKDKIKDFTLFLSNTWMKQHTFISFDLRGIPPRIADKIKTDILSHLYDDGYSESSLATRFYFFS